jgi:hypothetical protein
MEVMAVALDGNKRRSIFLQELEGTEKGQLVLVLLNLFVRRGGIIAGASRATPHRVLELFNAFPQATPQIGQFARPENNQDDQQDEKQVCRLKQSFHKQASGPDRARAARAGSIFSIAQFPPESNQYYCRAPNTIFWAFFPSASHFAK